MTRRRIRRAAVAAVLAVGSAQVSAHAAGQAGSGGTAGLRTIDTASLATVQATTAAVPSGPLAGAPVLQARASALRPAPVPDQDLDAPGPSREALADQEQARLQPSFYAAPRQGFSGDGFASGSTLNDDHANRRRPGGGMSLSIPVQ